MTSPYYLAGADLTAGLLNAAPAPLLARKTTNFPVTNNGALQTDSQLSIAVPANTAWALDSCLIYNATSTADANFGLAVPTGSTWWEASGALGIPATATSDVIEMVMKQSSAIGVGGGGQGITNSLIAPYRATVFVAANAGNIAIRFCQWTAEASTATLEAGSWMILWKLA